MITRQIETIKTNLNEVTIFKSNQLIWECHNLLDLREQQLFDLLLSDIGPYDTEFRTQYFQIVDILRILQIENRDRNKKNLMNIIQAMRDKSFWYHTSTGEIALISTISRPIFDYKRENVSMKLDDSLEPYLLGLNDKKNFTVVNMQYIINVRSQYAMPLYEFLWSKQFDKKKWEVKFSIQKLREVLNCHGTLLDWYEFKRVALMRALKEINKCTNIDVVAKYVIVGKTVEEVIFCCSLKPKMTSKSENITKDLKMKSPKSKVQKQLNNEPLPSSNASSEIEGYTYVPMPDPDDEFEMFELIK